MSNLLTAEQLEALNEKFFLDLSFSDATHYRAALVIHQLDKSSKVSAADQESTAQDSKD